MSRVTYDHDKHDAQSYTSIAMVVCHRLAGYVALCLSMDSCAQLFASGARFQLHFAMSRPKSLQGLELKPSIYPLHPTIALHSRLQRALFSPALFILSWVLWGSRKFGSGHPGLGWTEVPALPESAQVPECRHIYTQLSIGSYVHHFPSGWSQWL